MDLIKRTETPANIPMRIARLRNDYPNFRGGLSRGCPRSQRPRDLRHPVYGKDHSMKSFRVTLAAGILAASMGSIVPAHSQNTSKDTSKPAQATAADLTGLHDFDFQVGEWRVHHRVKNPADNHQWLEFDGTCSNRRLMDGWANVEDHTFNKPTGVSRGVGLRAYDPKSGQWAIWWIDGTQSFRRPRSASHRPF